jgi:prepilin-type N-terminal cleavage/methylation domain-containing protein
MLQAVVYRREAIVLILNARKQQGFTLIELLLVIAIVAALAAFGFSTFREYALNLKAEKVAQQMQLILQVASNYYTRNNCWPSNYPPGSSNQGHSCIEKPFPISERFVATLVEGGGYFPEGGAMRRPGDPYNFRLYNPFSTTLLAGGADNPNTAYWYRSAGPPTHPDTIFQLDSGALPNADFARRVAALLPNARVTSDNTNGLAIPFEVSAQIYPPGTQYVEPFLLVKAGVISEVDNVEFSCPATYQRVFVASLQANQIKNGPVNLGTGEGGIVFHFQINASCSSVSGINQYRCTIQPVMEGRIAVFTTAGGGGWHARGWENVLDTSNGKHVHFTYIAGCCLPQGGADCAYP